MSPKELQSRAKNGGSALAELAQFAARIGGDPTLVQGPGGNTSLKDEGILFVKASGAWLAQGERESIHVPLRLDPLRDALADDANCRMADFVVPGLLASDLRPSIETSLHAILPHRIVVHVHCVRTIALAVLVDGRERVGACLQGLSWQWVPYVKPGPDLARAVARILLTGTPDILVLQNHGLVIGGSSVANVEANLSAVLRRLSPALRVQATGGAAATLSAPPGFELPRFAEAHSLAHDPLALRVCRRGSLYPDHVVFLGRAIAATDDPAGVPDGAGMPKLIVITGRGVLVRAGLSAAGHEMARALAQVAARIPVDGTVRYLSAAEEDELLDWEAEKYRQNIPIGH